MKTEKQAGWPVSPESREKNRYVPIKTFSQNQKVFFLWKVFSGSSDSARPLNLSYIPSMFSQKKKKNLQKVVIVVIPFSPSVFTLLSRILKLNSTLHKMIHKY